MKEVFDNTAATSRDTRPQWRATEPRSKVLIVDDDAAVTQQLFWSLCDEFEVWAAHDLGSAVRRATIYEPDIVLLDLHLPPTPDAPATGLRILEYVKGRLPASKVFVISAAAGPEVRAECRRRGADDFFGKPMDVERLLSEVRGAARGSRPES